MAKIIPEATKLRAIELHDAGESNLEIARRLNVSEGAVRKWCKEREAIALRAAASTPAAPLPGIPLPTNGDVDEPPAANFEIDVSSTESTLEAVQDLLQRTANVMARAEADGNHTATVRALKELASGLAMSLRIQREMKADKDTVAIDLTEYEQARAMVRERIKSLAARPLTCIECGRALRIAIAQDGKVDPDDDRNDTADDR